MLGETKHSPKVKVFFPFPRRVLLTLKLSQYCLVSLGNAVGPVLPKLLLLKPIGSGFLYVYYKDGERKWSASIDGLIAVCNIFS